jgi:hypothetical protein
MELEVHNRSPLGLFLRSGLDGKLKLRNLFTHFNENCSGKEINNRRILVLL